MKPEKSANEMTVKELAAYIDYSVLKPEFTEAVSYTHLDVYKRQIQYAAILFRGHRLFYWLWGRHLSLLEAVWIYRMDRPCRSYCVH